MCLKLLVTLYFSVIWILNSLEKYSTRGAKCLSISLQDISQPECGNTTGVRIKQMTYMYDKHDKCESNQSSTSLTFYGDLPSKCDRSSLCIVLYHGMHKYLIIRFQCKDCQSIHAGNRVRTTCPITTVIWIANSDFRCRDQISSERNITYGETVCENSFTCSIPTIGLYNWIARMYVHCKGGSNITDEEISSESLGGPNYAVIAGGIIGVLLIISIIVGVFLLRRHYCSESGNAKKPRTLITNLNPTYDPTHGQPEQDNNQQVHLMNSPDAIHISKSHAVNVENTTNEESNMYSHLRTTVDDSDVMYDHTVRNAVHDTCDGDYGITHRRITEDDYDVSRNYRHSLTHKADPVYN